MQYEPGAKWQYCQSGINAGARIVEVVSGTSFDAFLQKRLFDPLGMSNTTFYPTTEQRARSDRHHVRPAHVAHVGTGGLDAVDELRHVGLSPFSLKDQCARPGGAAR